MKNPFRIGDLVYLRPLEKADAPLLTKWSKDQEVTRNLLRFQPMSVQVEEKFIESTASSEKDVVLGIAETRRVCW